MKKFTYLLFLAIGITACSVESTDSTENLLTADARYKATEVQPTFDYPLADICLGDPSNFQFNFEDKPGNMNIMLDKKVLGDNPETPEIEEFYYVNLFHDQIGGSGPIPYTAYFDTAKTYELRWKIGSGGWTEFTVNIKNCDPVCAYGKGYWTNHSSVNPGVQENMWPVSELMLGNTNYSQEELNKIMDAPNNEGNNLVIFSQHLIAAKLNVANGAGTTEINATIEDADALIGDLVVLVDSFTEDQKKTANNLKSILGAFNDAGCE